MKRVAAGEVIEVTDHGHPVAHIVPLRHGVLDQLILEGRATAATDDLLDLLEELQLPVSVGTGQQRPSEALAELRDDDR